MSRNSIAKNLKGPSLSPQLTARLEDSIFAAISGGGIVFDNVEITSGTIDGVVLGNNNPGPAIFTTIQSGNPSGQGYQVCFYGQAVGDSACWEPTIGRWNIQGDLLVRDISDLGNLRVSVNTLSSTNLNGNIIIDPNGTGSINLLGPVSQSSTTGNVAFAPVVGNFTVNAGNIVSTNSATDTFLRTSNGDITLETGTNITSKNISLITTGSTPTITTTSPHGLAVGDTVTISGSNSSPNINGDQLVTDVLSTTTFRISPGFSVLTPGTSGSFIQHNDIYLSATNNVNIPTNTKLVFGDDSTYIKANSDKELLLNAVDDIYLTPGTNKDIKIPDNIGLIFGSDLTRKIESDGTDLHLYPGTGTFVVEGNIKINGTSTIVESTVTVIKDPVITLGGNTPPVTDDNKDRGIEFRYHNGTTSKVGFFGFDDSTGCFTVIPDATNVNEVFSGAPGCINVGAVAATSLNLQGGAITNAGSFNICNISCPAALTISGGTSISVSSPISNFSGNVNFNGDTNTINGSTLNITSTNVSMTDNILTLYGITAPLTETIKDSGVLFRYNDGVSPKTGFFGWDDSAETFTFIPNATEVAGVISGVPGNVTFGSVNTCNIVCNGNLTISSVGSTTLTGANVYLRDPIVTLSENNVTIGDLRDRGVEFRYYNPSLPGTSSAFFGWDNSANVFTFLQNTTNSGEIITGTPGDVVFGNTTVNNLTVTGTVTGVNTSFSTEHLTLPGNSSGNPASNINITFVRITSPGITTGTLTAPSTDGYSKYIFCSSLASGSEYHLICPAGMLLDPGSGTAQSKKIKFDTPGQSLYIIWDNVISSYLVINGNACISSP